MAKDEAEEQQDPSVELSRDETGRYLHLKLKRFASIKELNMSYAKQTWKQTPHDAEVDIYCAIFKCHEGCKKSGYFHVHPPCFYEYPETKKLTSVEEIKGFDDLEDLIRKKSIQEAFDGIQRNNGCKQVTEEAKNNTSLVTTPAKKKRRVQK